MKKKIQVVLLKEVSNLGNRLDVVVVASGYFRNHLLPQGLAESATEDVLERTKEDRERLQREREEHIAKRKEQAKKLERVTLKFKKKARVKKLYGSISEEDISSELAKNGIEGVSVELDEPIKDLGEHSVTINFGDGVKGSVKVLVGKE